MCRSWCRDSLRTRAPRVRRRGSPWRPFPGSRPWRSGGQVVALDLVDQRGAADPELDRRAGAVTRVVLERALDVLALEVVEAERRVPAVADARTGAEFSRQMLDAHGGRAAPEDQCALQHVAHLTH